MLQETVSLAKPLFSTGDIIATATACFTYLIYRLDQRKTITANQDRHTENVVKLDRLVSFQAAQIDLNQERDRQMNELARQTNKLVTQVANLVTIVTSTERRVQRLENLEDQR